MNWNLLNSEEINNDELNNYELITRNDLDKLKIGMHIKYIKKMYNLETDKIENKIYNGGFLINILNIDNPINLILIVKSNIIWKLHFIKYKIYGKQINKFNNIQNNFKELYKNEILEKNKKDYLEVQKLMDEINKKKNNYKIIFDK